MLDFTQGLDIRLLNDDFSNYLAFLGDEDEPAPDEDYATALGIVMDTGTAKRVSNQKYTLCKEIIKFDHHIPIESYGDYELVVTVHDAAHTQDLTSVSLAVAEHDTENEAAWAASVSGASVSGNWGKSLLSVIIYEYLFLKYAAYVLYGCLVVYPVECLSLRYEYFPGGRGDQKIGLDIAHH